MEEEVRRCQEELGRIYPSQVEGSGGTGGARGVEMKEVDDEGD